MDQLWFRSKWRSPRVSGILLHPAKPMAWINCGLDQRLDHITPQRPADENRQARQESGCTRPASRRCRLWMRETSQAGEQLHASRFAEISIMDERNKPGRRVVARVLLRGDVGYGWEKWARQESRCTRPASRRCRLWMRETSQAGEQLHASRFKKWHCQLNIHNCPIVTEL